MTWAFHRCGQLNEWAVEENGRHICKVFTEQDAARICRAMNLSDEFDAAVDVILKEAP